MSKIENLKSYSGQNLDTIFFRPMLTGANAEQLGVKVMYNVPMPTTLNFWNRNPDVLNKFTTGKWQGGTKSQKYQKKIDMQKVKAESSYGSDDYFATIFEMIAARADVNFDDLSGTELEEAETELFRQAIAESIRVSMWYGDTSRTSGFNSFDGVVKKIIADHADESVHLGYVKDYNNSAWAERLLKQMWEKSNEQLRTLRSEGNLAFFVTSDIYNAYEDSLDNVAIEAAYLSRQNGRDQLFYRGIPVVDLQMNEYKYKIGSLPTSFALLTDRRNIALAVNTSEFPGSEVRMWYNPDEMENRQRAVFAAGCDYLLPELMTIATELPFEVVSSTYDGTTYSLSLAYGSDVSDIDYVTLCTYDKRGELDCDSEEVTVEASTNQTFEYQASSFSSAELTVGYSNGYYHRFTLETTHE